MNLPELTQTMYESSEFGYERTEYERSMGTTALETNNPFCHYPNTFQFCPSDCFLCCQSLHGVVQNENYLSEKDFLTLLPTYSP